MSIMDNIINKAADDDLARLTEHTTRSHRVKTADGEGWIRDQTWSFVDGEHVTLTGETDDDFMFPASAGYDVLTFEVPNDGDPATFDIGDHIHRKPVIGWNLTIDQGQDLVKPVTLEGRERAGRAFTFKAVSYPDGRVAWHGPFPQRSQYDECQPICASLDEWIGMVREVWPEVIKREEEEEQRRVEAEKPCPHCGRYHDDIDDEIPFGD